ncbi:hypothetical protein DL96DRAFT_1814578 [Flagelloscypha sp. PMI_526]|nr:hypothetical protein DL96DRAFT_1814578 [Flagelloscypha sp. PMI_526]
MNGHFQVIEKPLQDVLLNTSRDAFCRVRSLSLDGLEEIPVAFLAGFPSLTTLELYRLGQRPVSFDHRASFPPRNIALVALYIGDKHLAQAAWLFPLVSATLCSLSLDISSFNSVDRNFVRTVVRPSASPPFGVVLAFLSPNAPLRNLKFASEYFDPLISTPEMWAGIAKEVVKRNTQIHLEFSAYETDRTTFSPEWLVLVTKWFHEESLREVSENGLLGQVDVIRLDDECTLGADSLFD